MAPVTTQRTLERIAEFSEGSESMGVLAGFWQGTQATLERLVEWRE
ncbi:hypothetical protein LCGC14_0791010 [marine sediment metagenome]|uniref:Uncharacterized protein n=1 Tax=marine sediment metagenome TaxID=412755 RepID=A0A0F9PWX8_9ZZZZ